MENSFPLSRGNLEQLHTLNKAFQGTFSETLSLSLLCNYQQLVSVPGTIVSLPSSDKNLKDISEKKTETLNHVFSCS